jgi:hypothetical protein
MYPQYYINVDMKNKKEKSIKYLTMRIPEKLMEKFRKKCADHLKTMSESLRQFIECYTEQETFSSKLIGVTPISITTLHGIEEGYVFKFDSGFSYEVWEEMGETLTGTRCHCENGIYPQNNPLEECQLEMTMCEGIAFKIFSYRCRKGREFYDKHRLDR